MAFMASFLPPILAERNRQDVGDERRLLHAEGGGAFELHPVVAELLEAARVLGGEGLLAEALDLGGGGAGLAQAQADRADEGETVPAAEADVDLGI
jgi:hypothetical protein